MKTCIDCKQEKAETDFYLRDKAKGYRESYCKECSKERAKRKNKDRYDRDPEFRAQSLARKTLLESESRKLGNKIDRWLVSDSRRSDNKKGRENDLTREVVRQILAKGACTYCGDTTTRFTLDRIDNDIGHIVSNVNLSCVRCNMVRGHMPYVAWLTVAKGMKEAREQDLFGDWTGEIHKR